MEMISRLFVLAAMAFLAGAGFSRAIYVDDNALNDPDWGSPAVSDPLEDGSLEHPFDAIQKAIDAAANGDTILVADGTYTGGGNRDMNFCGKAITVQSTSGPEACIIDCQATATDQHRAFLFENGETNASVLAGFSIVNGYAPSEILFLDGGEYPVSCGGGAIFCEASSPIIRNCHFENNAAWEITSLGDGVSMSSGPGGAIACFESSTRIEKCQFRNGVAMFGGAISAANSATEIVNCLLADNFAEITGSAVHVSGGECGISHCTVANNPPPWSEYLAEHYSIPHTICASNACVLSVTNSILWEDRLLDDDGTCTVSVTYSNVKTGFTGVGNISTEPYFIDPSRWTCFNVDNWDKNVRHIGTDYRVWNRTWVIAEGGWVYLNNPCVDSGDPAAACAVDDFHGITRPLDGDGDGQAVADMGAFEFDPNSIPRIRVTRPHLELAIREDHIVPIGGGIYMNVATDRIQVHTGDTQPLYWQVVNNSDWLHVSPLSGASITDANFVTVLADIEGLSVGVHQGSFEIVDTEDNTHRQTVTVTLTIKSVNLHVPENYATIMEAIDWAHDGETVMISDGVYSGPGNRNLNFDWRTITVQSRSGPEHCIIECVGKHAVRGFHFNSGEGPDSVLRGVTIRGGSDFNGSGILIENSSPTIENCILTDNRTYVENGGALCLKNSNSVIADCLIENNSGKLGGGIYCENGRPIIHDCIITANESGDGGGIYCFHSDAIISHCTVSNNFAVAGGGIFIKGRPSVIDTMISGNTAWANGGGILVAYGEADIRNCVIAGNRCYDSGGGVVFGPSSESSAQLANCTIAQNTSGQSGGGVFCEGYNRVSAVNCILWGNTGTNGAQVAVASYIPEPGFSFAYCNVQGGLQGIHIRTDGNVEQGPGNIDADPCFVRTGWWDDNGTPHDIMDDTWIDGDYRLQSEGWRWDSDISDWTWDAVTSRCIDAGNPGCALEAEPVTLEVDPRNRCGVNVRIDMGAYGGTEQASMAPPGWMLLGDLDNSGSVDYHDTAILAAAWLQTGETLPADVSRDSVVDLEDIAVLTLTWLHGSSWNACDLK